MILNIQLLFELTWCWPCAFSTCIQPMDLTCAN